MANTRQETDSLGIVEVPADKLWGAQTQRSLEHFSIGKDLIPREMITSYATLKKAAAIANRDGRRLDDQRYKLIVQTCDEILAGQHGDMLPLHVWMTGSGTQFNMNVNEVISNRCSQQHAECTAEQAYTWSKGKAIYAAGVQFPPVRLDGQTFLPGQANNFYIFPAIGMAIFATQASRVTDEMFIEAARAVADQVPSDLLNQGLLYPLQSNILETEIQTAARVAKLVFDARVARVERPADMVAFIRRQVYKPAYPVLTTPATKAA